MSRVVEWDLPGADGQPIIGDSHLPTGQARGVLLICHGFKGYKDYGLFPQLAEAAAQRGMVAHRFNFSHSGMTRRIETFERPDLFERDTWGKQIVDLRGVACAAANGKLPGDARPNTRQVWFGHSRGGVAAILTAGEAFASDEPQTVRPVGVIAAASPHVTDRLDPDQKAMLRRAGRVASPSSRTGQLLHVGVDWLDELERDPDRYDLSRQIQRIACPILLLHGDDDATVDVMSAKLLKKAAGDRARLRIIPGANHTFNAPNPLPLDATPPPQTQALIDATCAFAVESSGA